MGSVQRRHRVVVIGLDGATWDLLWPWITDGKLPFLQKVIDGGCWGSLNSVYPPGTAPAWTSMYTGKNPGKHGIFEFMMRQPGTYNVAPSNASKVDGKNVWDILGEAGKKVILLNLPLTYPPRAVNGILVTGLLTPPNEQGFTYPSDLARELMDQLGEYVVTPREVFSPGRTDQFLKELHHLIDLRSSALQYLGSRYDWDFLMVVFNETDMIQHALWCTLDSSHPSYDEAFAARYGEAVLDCYQHIDRCLADFAESLDDETTIIIVSDHGAGPVYRYINLNNWLLENGYLVVKRIAKPRIKYRLFRWGLSPLNIYEAITGWGPDWMRNLTREVRWSQSGYGLMRRLFFSLDDIDWAQTKAYALGGGVTGEIFINLDGREPQGIVAAGQEYAGLREELAQRLRTFVDPSSGQPLIGQVYTREDLYSGGHLDLAPDLVVTARCVEDAFFGDFEFMSGALIRQTPKTISAQHRMQGILTLTGPGINKGKHFLHNAGIVDVAPTVLYALGIPIPADVDGRVLTEAYEPGVLAARLPQYDDETPRQASEDFHYSEEETEEIKKRLRSLGYLQ